MSIKLAETHYYIVDTETTGLSADNNEIFQISIIRCSDRNQLTKWIKCENLDAVSPRALEVTNSTMADLVKGDAKEDVVDACNRFFDDDGAGPEQRCIIGHNIIGFDKRFLYRLWEKCDSPFPANMWLCTLQYMRKYAKQQGLPSKGLDLNSSCKILGIKPKLGAHSAVIDTQNNYFLWKGLQKTGIPQIHLVKRFKQELK